MNDFVRKRDKGMNLKEKIEKKKAVCKKRGMVKTFDGYFYDKLDSGVNFYVKDIRMDEHSPLITGPHNVPMTDFSKPVLIAGDEKPETSDDDDGWKDIPSSMQFDSKSGIMDY
jgi:hypothetical protein